MPLKRGQMPVDVAIVGPEDLVEKVCLLQPEYPSLNLVPSKYADENELPLLFPQIYANVDIIIFTGPLIFKGIISVGRPSKPLLFVPLHGSGLLRCMYLQQGQDHSDLTRVSIDTLRRNIVIELFKDLDLPDDGVFIKEDVASLDNAATELTKFHYDLWRAGKTSVAFTCLRSTYLKLQELNAPVMRILPTNAASRETLKMAVIQGNQLHSMDTQIAVQLCHIGKRKEKYSKYKEERLRLLISQILNNYAEQTWASVHRASEDRYLIFSTRGILEKTSNYYQSDPLLENFRRNILETVSIGIGLGRTAYHAENHAEQALNRAFARGGNCTYVLTDNGNMLGPIGDLAMLEAKVEETDERILAIAQVAGLSVETINKIRSTIKVLGKESMTSYDLSQAIQITPRNARRMLSRLADAGYAHVIGKEQSATSGRPRLIYHITKFR